MDRGAWRTAVPGVAKSLTGLKNRGRRHANSGLYSGTVSAATKH